MRTRVLEIKWGSFGTAVTANIEGREKENKRMKSAFRLSGMNFNLKTTSVDWEMLSSRFTASRSENIFTFENYLLRVFLEC